MTRCDRSSDELNASLKVEGIVVFQGTHMKMGMMLTQLSCKISVILVAWSSFSSQLTLNICVFRLSTSDSATLCGNLEEILTFQQGLCVALEDCTKYENTLVDVQTQSASFTTLHTYSNIHRVARGVCLFPSAHIYQILLSVWTSAESQKVSREWRAAI